MDKIYTTYTYNTNLRCNKSLVFPFNTTIVYYIDKKTSKWWSIFWFTIGFGQWKAFNFWLSVSAVCHHSHQRKIQNFGCQTLPSATCHYQWKTFNFGVSVSAVCHPLASTKNLFVCQTLPSATHSHQQKICLFVRLCRLPPHYLCVKRISSWLSDSAVCHHFLKFLTTLFLSLPPCHPPVRFFALWSFLSATLPPLFKIFDIFLSVSATLPPISIKGDFLPAISVLCHQLINTALRALSKSSISSYIYLPFWAVH